MNVFEYDFGYAWPWTLGHLLAAVVFGVLAAATWRLAWRRIGLVFLVLTVWAIAGASIVHFVMRFNLPLELPTERFLPSGVGRVLDGGAGSGRSSLMVLLARPESTLVALDSFGAGYGIEGNTPERLLANAAAAGASGRVEVRVGDMREMPFADASFDAAVSAYAIDHLNREGVARALAETKRVLRPGGQFLLMAINPDAWIRVALPFFFEHGYFGSRPIPDVWRERLTAAGLEVVEQGTRPGTLYILSESSN